MRVTIPRLPARHDPVVVELVLHIPTKHHVAKTKARIRRGQEFVAREVFAAEHTIRIEHPHLVALDPLRLQVLLQTRFVTHRHL